MNKIWLPVISISLAVFAIANAIRGSGDLQAAQASYSSEKLDHNFEYIQHVLVNLVGRIETLEKKLKIDPGKNAVRLELKEKRNEKTP